MAARPLSIAAGLLALAVALPARGGDEGRGVAVYPHKSVKRSEIGSGPRSYTLFEPAEPTPQVAPVVAFHHGWLAMNPGVYGAWIDHLARRGFVVIYPRYMEPETQVNEFLPNALDAIVDAFDVLETSPAHVKPDRRKFALIGHSTGGVLAIQVAALARSRGLPEPTAVVAVTPGEFLKPRGPSLGDVPAATLLVVIAAEHDVVTGDGRARQIFREATSIPPSRKKFILYRSDVRGRPVFWADHLAPTASLASYDDGNGPFHDFQMLQGATNAIDREGFWKVADITLAAGFAGKTLDDATDRGAAFRGLGYWSDGRPVLSPIVADDTDFVPHVFPSHGLRIVPWPYLERPGP